MKSFGAWCVALTAASLATQVQCGEPVTCGDLPGWGVPVANGQPLNNPSAADPTDSNSLAVNSEANKKKAYLNCSPALLGAAAASRGSMAGLSQVDQVYLAALRESRVDRLKVSKAIYMNSLNRSPNSWTTYSAGAVQWRLEQATSWCEANDPGGNANAKIPGFLFGLMDGVGQLDGRAITLGWSAVERLKVDQLGLGCDAAVKAFVKRVLK
jgi:hypothetical protein